MHVTAPAVVEAASLGGDFDGSDSRSTLFSSAAHATVILWSFVRSYLPTGPWPLREAGPLFPLY